MKNLYKLTAAVALLALSAAALLTFVPGLTDVAAAGHFVTGMGDITQAIPVALAALHQKRDGLKAKARKKRNEITDDLDDDQVRAIETAHAGILEELETVVREIDNFVDTDESDDGDVDENRAASGLSGAQAADALRTFRSAGMTEDQIDTALRECSTIDDVRTRVFDHLSERSLRTPTTPARVLRDETETRRLGMATAMAVGMGAPMPEGDRGQMARDYMRHHDVVEFAAEHIGHRGSIRTVRDREEILSRAFHTASDFPAIFSDAINVNLESQYALAAPTYRQISRRRDFMDFRAHSAVGVGEFPMLEKLTDAGEIKFGTFGESKETIAVLPYARAIRLSRQMLVNDRLGALGQIMGGYGRTVSRFEEIIFYTMMKSTDTKLADGKVVYHADHNNLAGSGAAITVASIGAGKAAMRKQKGLDDATLNLTPSVLLVSPDKETEALQYLAPIMASDSVKVNPHVGTLAPVVASELTGNGWYLFANPEDAAVYQWGYLDGYEAPRVRFDEPFGTQGIGMSVEHDFGVGAIDYRGGYKNPGA